MLIQFGTKSWTTKGVGSHNAYQQSTTLPISFSNTNYILQATTKNINYKANWNTKTVNSITIDMWNAASSTQSANSFDFICIGC